MSDCRCGRCGRCHQRITQKKEGRWPAPPGMLRPPGIGVPDSPPELFPLGPADNAARARAYEPFIARGLSDAEAWEARFTEEQRLASAKAVYGKRLRRPRPPRRRLGAV